MIKYLLFRELKTDFGDSLLSKVLSNDYGSRGEANKGVEGQPQAGASTEAT